MGIGKPVFSVVITSYNLSDYIGECLESILRQSFRDLEVICVDDCSTDGTFDILTQYQATDERVRVIRCDRNQGVSIARNIGIDASQGEYLLFLDGDDYHADGSLRFLYDTIKENDLDLLLFDYEVTHSSGNPNLIDLHPKPRVKSIDQIMSGADLLTLQVSEKEYRPCVYLQLVKAKVLKEAGIRFFPGIIHEDELYTPLIMEKARRAMCVADKMYMRRVRSGSIMTTDISHKNVDGYFVVSTELLAHYLSGGCQNEGIAMRAKSMRGASRDRYRLLSDEEKAKSGKDLPEIYRFFFERNDFKFDDQKKRNNALEQRVAELEAVNSNQQEEIQKLIEKCNEYAETNTKYQQKIKGLEGVYSDLVHSCAFRIGRTITFIPRKLRDFFKSIRK